MIKTAIVGTGPSGVYCALQLIDIFKKSGINSYRISLFDESETLKTLLPTGNGRCNISFDEPDFKKFASFYPRGEKFLYSVLSRYSTHETLLYFKKLGIETYTQQDRRIFPVTNSAKYVAKRLVGELRKTAEVNFIKNKIKNVQELDEYDNVVLAAGAKGTAELAKQYGHTIIPLKPALCGLKINKNEFNFPTGVSFNTKEGGVIFTDKGVSGPYIYKISSLNAYKEFPYEIKIPLIKPDELFELLNAYPKKSFGNVVSTLVPKSLAKVTVKNFDKQCANVSKKEVYELESLNLTVTGVDGKGEIVHAGGVSLKEINKNCKSKIKENVWIIGEGLDIDGLTGGFNLQNCWSSAAVAANDIAKLSQTV